ncbi:hypothetical protein EDB81DRAFT_761611 [Dactylonectria macrodidyma]|uniref:Uncharacterized protein n=1 Tax=Dactylonectria macrodidyma TaxID=307937 RepID=A0A9P9J0D4_9HYPO|nr:hypothetical protein EDB81DRAFT_761611 [Dactylonectria macrodidyma]
MHAGRHKQRHEAHDDWSFGFRCPNAYSSPNSSNPESLIPTADTMISENTMGTPSSTPSSTPDYGAWAIASPSPTPTRTSSSESETPLPTSTNSSLSFVSPTLTLAPTTSLPTITSTGSAAHHNQAFLSIIMWPHKTSITR